jgi:hypothetical protein
MNPILDRVSGLLGGDTIQQLGNQLGTDDTTTARAVQAALPILLAALARNANASPADAQSLHQAVEQDHDGSILDDLSGFLGHPQAGNGAGILEHVLSGKRGAVETGVSRATGLDTAKTSQLLMMLAPLVMGALGRARREQKLGEDELARGLREGREEIENQTPQLGGGALSRILDHNNDGQIADDVAKIASTIVATGVLGRLGRGRQ